MLPNLLFHDGEERESFIAQVPESTSVDLVGPIIRPISKIIYLVSTQLHHTKKSCHPYVDAKIIQGALISFGRQTPQRNEVHLHVRGVIACILPSVVFTNRKVCLDKSLKDNVRHELKKSWMCLTLNRNYFQTFHEGW